jgi:integrase
VFRHAYEAGLIEAPVRYGPGFKRPSRKVLRLARAAKGPRLFGPAEIRAMLAAARPALKAMILLGINCGFGNADCGRLPRAALDLEGGWVSFPRPKTGIARRCPLWRETVEALKAALARRPVPKDPAHEGLVFVTIHGHCWAKSGPGCPVTGATIELLRRLRLYRPGLNFYALRHTLETVGGESKDQVAVDPIMGHVREDMASVYSEKISDERLRAVTDHVRSWLFGPRE